MTRNLTELTYDTFRWLDIYSPEKEQLEEIACKYQLDLYHIKDSMEPGHLPKIEHIKNFNFIILRAYTANEFDNVSMVGELSNKIAFFYNDKQLITIHRTEFGFLNSILKNNHCKTSIFSLMIQIFSEIINSYLEPAQWQSNQIDEVEKTIFLKNSSKISLENLYFQKSETRISKKLLILTQNVLNQLDVPDEDKTALQDVKDQLIKLILQYEEALEDANNLMNTYLSVTAQKNNDVMKLLTIFSAFFLPLTFIVGVYGMNFDFMPELRWKFGYLSILLFMIGVAVLIFIWFKKKKII